jgi:hypothetical protein
MQERSARGLPPPTPLPHLCLGSVDLCVDAVQLTLRVGFALKRDEASTQLLPALLCHEVVFRIPCVTQPIYLLGERDDFDLGVLDFLLQGERALQAGVLGFIVHALHPRQKPAAIHSAKEQPPQKNRTVDGLILWESLVKTTNP